MRKSKQEKLNVKDRKENSTLPTDDNNAFGLYDNELNMQRLTMSDPLVIIVCISDYESAGLANLPSVKKDMASMQALWEDKYHFNVKTNKTMSKNNDNYEYKFSKDDWLNLSDETSLILRKNKHDGLIFIYSGHGYQDGILTSRNEKISFNSIKKKFNAKNIPQLKDKPKIFIVDACRCLNPKLPFDKRYANDEYDDELECKLNRKEIKGGRYVQEEFKFYHPDANVLEIYGNTSGFSAVGDVNGGGSLIGPIGEYFNVSENILKRKTFQQLLNPVKRKVHRTSDGNQNVEINDTILGYELYLGIHGSFSSDNDSGDKEDDVVKVGSVGGVGKEDKEAKENKEDKEDKQDKEDLEDKVDKIDGKKDAEDKIDDKTTQSIVEKEDLKQYIETLYKFVNENRNQIFLFLFILILSHILRF